jgi:integrating conjugative element protein (TIGR03757 family)
VRDAFRFRTGVALLLGCLVAAAVPAQVTRDTRTTSVVAGAAGSAPDLTVEVFSNSAIPLTGASGATVYLLDGLQLLEAELSAGLPADETRAQKIAAERMRRLGPHLQQRVANAARGLTLARQYGIERVPAVVINGGAIVYGVTDVERAVTLYRQQQGGKR